ncbi:heme A synthase [Corynebacterium sp.]|uniref:COX15/CtaA family protein n=1 Tax=Corynebacterium sp. TaxID=1720 RepID=UPI0026DA9FE4|nr:COX15/CtaA family protein [Corynebacterium sp.]MDO5077430.1 cytochrome oxidase assembly protein [Corynebacterium sp.]
MNAFVRFSTFVVFGAVALGAVVCATDSSAACPNWPGCYEGQITPEIQLNPIIEFVHRVFSVSCAPVIIISAILLRKHPDPRVRWLPWVALLGAFGAGIFGMMTIWWGLTPFQGMLDLWCAFTSLICMTIVCAQLGQPKPNATRARVAGITIGGLALLHGTGILVAGASSFTRCIGWPLGITLEADHNAPLQIARVVLAVALIGLFIWLRSIPIFVAVIVELVIGIVIRTTALNDFNGSLYGVVAVVILTAVAWEWGNAWQPRKSKVLQKV